MTTAQVVFVSLWAGLGPLQDFFFALAQQTSAKGSDHALGDGILDGENVFELAIESLREAHAVAAA